MPKYVIERTIPGARSMSEEEWRGAAGQSNDTLDALGEGIYWIHSYVTPDKIYCVYEADNPEIIREHGEKGGFPVDSVNEVVRMLDPTTAG